MAETLPAEIVETKMRPAEITEVAKDAAKNLLAVVESAGMVVKVNNQKYLRYEGWQTLGGFMGRAYGGPVTVGGDEAEPVENGYRAHARAWCEGRVISEAVAYCYRDEKQWAKKPAFQLASMAQTRACSKALRNVLGWVLTLANTGIKTTPAEEMEAEPEGPPPDMYVHILSHIEDAKKVTDLRAVPAQISDSKLDDDNKAALRQAYTDKQKKLANAEG